MLFDWNSIVLNIYENRLCKALADLIRNDIHIHIITGEEIERRLRIKINTNKFNEISACKMYKHILHFHKDYIIQTFNNHPIYSKEFTRIKTIRPKVKYQVECLLVNYYAIKNGIEF
jgi:hypothetical protein